MSKEPSPTDAVASPRGTLVFGAAVPADRAPPQGVPRGTRIFGASAAPAVPITSPERPNRGTLVFGVPPASPLPGAPATASAEPPVPPAPARSTQVFGASAAAASDAGDAGEDPRKTRLFGAISPAEQPPAQPVPEVRKTQMFGAPLTSVPPASAPSPEVGGPRGARLALPPEPVPDLLGAPLDFARGNGGEELDLPPRSGAGRTFLVLLVLGVLAGAAFAGHRFLAQRQEVVDRSWSSALENAFIPLRRDDSASRHLATERLTALMQKRPSDAQARAAYLMALSLELDDRRTVLNHLQTEASRLTEELNELQFRHPRGWQEDVDRRIARIKGIKEETDPLVDAANVLQDQLRRANEALPQGGPARPEDEAALLRARALYGSIKGDLKSLEFASRYRALNPGDGWEAVVQAEYVLNSDAQPEPLHHVVKAMRELSRADPAFLRAHVLAARAAIRLKDAEVARSELEAVLTLNPVHELARQLLTWEQSPDHEHGRK